MKPFIHWLWHDIVPALLASALIVAVTVGVVWLYLYLVTP